MAMRTWYISSTFKSLTILCSLDMVISSMKHPSIFLLFALAFFETTSAQSVTNPVTGRTWMDKNLGASQVAISSTDSASFGHLYQWGRASDGHQLRSSGTTADIAGSDSPGHDLFILGSDDWLFPSNPDLWYGWDGINNPCPWGFSIPTEAEWLEEIATWDSQDAAGAMASLLRLPLAGARSRMSGTIGNVNAFVGYRTRESSGTDTRNLGIAVDVALMGNRAKADGNCVRCIFDDTSGLDETQGSEPLPFIYPNPTNNTVTLQSTTGALGCSYIICDARGEIVAEGRILKEDQSIDLHSLASGLYHMYFSIPIGASMRLVKN